MRLIFHGDDFGLTEGVNEGIVRAFKEGLLTSASVIASGEAVQEALALAKRLPGLDLGVHLTLCDERPVLPAHCLPSLIPSGDRLPPRARLVESILSRRIDVREVEAEWRAQVEVLLEAGVRISHLDSHQFVHLFPGLLAVTLSILKKYRIPFARGAIVEPPSLQYGMRRLVQWIGIAAWSRCRASRSLAAVCRVIPSVGFLSAGGRLTRSALIDMVTRLQTLDRDRTLEVILHPGSGDDLTLTRYGHWRYDWKKDLELVLDDGLKEDLAGRGILTTSFTESI